MSLSNATKNQRDAFSRMMQSYSTKITHSLMVLFMAYRASSESITNAMIMVGVAFPFAIDSIYGCYVLKRVFAEEAHINETNLLDQEKNVRKEDKIEKKFNNRLPEMLS